MKNRTKQDIYTLYLRKRRKGVLRMFTIFKEEKVITAGILVFLCLSVLVRLMLAWMYHTMIRETDNMATTGNRLLKQCKVRELLPVKRRRVQYSGVCGQVLKPLVFRTFIL